MYEAIVARVRYHIQKANFMGLKEAESTLLLGEAADAIEELNRKYIEERNAAVELTGELASKPRWIPVTERLPKFEGAVLCMRKSNVYGVRAYQEILYVDEYGFKNYDDIYLADGVVTHWQPLPQPPEEGET